MYFNKNKNLKDIDSMILCAGRGSRMRFMTKFLAKPLLKIDNISMLDTIIKKITTSGINKIVINTNYMPYAIKKSIKNLKYKIRSSGIELVVEKQRLETGGGIKNAINIFDKSSLLVVNGDSILNSTKQFCPIKNLYSNFKKIDMDVLLLLSKKKYSLGYTGHGDYRKMTSSYKSQLTSKYNSNFEKYIFTGWQIINKNILNSFPEKVFSLKKVYDLAEKKGRLYGITHSGIFFHVGDPKSYSLAKKFIKINKLKII